MGRMGRKPTSRRRLRLPVVAVVVALLMVMTVSACAPTKKGGPGPRVMLVGDSIAADLAAPLSFAFGARGWAFHPAAQPGCGIVRGVSSDFHGTPPPQAAYGCDAAIWGVHEAKVDEFRPSVVLWFGFIEEWGRYVDNHWYAPGPWPLPFPPVYPGATPGTSGPDGDAKILQLIEEKRAQFTQHGAKLVFVTMPPPATDSENHGERVAHLNQLFKLFVAAHPGDTALLDLATIACPPAGQACPTVIDGIHMRPDLYHFSPAGAAWMVTNIVAHL